MLGSDFRDYVVRIFVRTDKDTQLYEAVTDSVAELDRAFSFDEREVEKTTADIISVLGDYKLNMESDHGLWVADIDVLDGDQSYQMEKILKDKYDRMFPNNDSATAFRARPKFYCIFDGQIYLGPIPDQTSYTYKVSYTKRGDTITSGTANVPYSATYKELLREMTLAKLFGGMEGSEDKEDRHQAKADKLLRQAKKREWNLKQSGGECIENQDV